MSERPSQMTEQPRRKRRAWGWLAPRSGGYSAVPDGKPKPPPPVGPASVSTQRRGGSDVVGGSQP